MAGNTRSFPIHTFGVGLGASVEGRRNLEMIAAANQGKFREAEVPREMRELALQKPRVFNNQPTASAWGRGIRVYGRGFQN